MKLLVHLLIYTLMMSGCTTVRPSVDSRMRNIAGSAALNCGMVKLDASSDETQQAIDCANSQLALPRPFYVAFQLLGVDSAIWDGLSSEPSGGHVVTHYDSGGGGFFAQPRFDVSKCEQPVLMAKTSTPVSCGSGL
jgi:hypothetical protein